jgi:hypothetical protein
MRTNRPHRSIANVPPILTLRAIKVVLDEDLARLYGVTTGQLNQALKTQQTSVPQGFCIPIERR